MTSSPLKGPRGQCYCTGVVSTHELWGHVQTITVAIHFLFTLLVHLKDPDFILSFSEVC
jgi:hypothetical protein